MVLGSVPTRRTAIQFPPHNQHHSARFLINSAIKLANPNYNSYIFSYPELIKYKECESEDAPYSLFKTVFPSWDNEPRKPGRGTIFVESTPELFKRWLLAACHWTIINKTPDERIVFINAWNEWGEGAHLEPDRRFGYAYLQAMVDALKSIQ
jgi:lipopolysaccharide biosynthesis protein